MRANIQSNLTHAALAVACAVTATIVSSAPAWAQEDFHGRWSTNYGAMRIEQDGDQVIGSYDFKDGRIRGDVDGRTLTGIWVQSTSDQRCDDERMHSHYWGRFEFHIHGDHFRGLWGSCDGPVNQGWDGER